MPEKKDLATARRMMKSPNKRTAKRGLKVLKEAKRMRRGLKK